MDKTKRKETLRKQDLGEFYTDIGAACSTEQDGESTLSQVEEIGDLNQGKVKLFKLGER